MSDVLVATTSTESRTDGADLVNVLPAKTYVSLSELFTWALQGTARDDAEVKQMAVDEFSRDYSTWGNHLGPDWLRVPLKLMQAGHAMYPTRTCESDEDHSFNQRAFEKVKSWLQRSGKRVETALVEAEEECARRHEDEQNHFEAERILYEQALSGLISIFARKWNGAKRRPAAEYTQIPTTFFLRPPRFCYHVFHGPSELVRWPDDNATYGLLDSVFNTNDPPDCYVEAMIERRDALKFRNMYWRSDRSESYKKLEKNVVAWLVDIIGASPGIPTASRNDLMGQAQHKFHGLTKEAFGRAWMRANEIVPASGWDKPGRRPKSRERKSSSEINRRGF